MFVIPKADLTVIDPTRMDALPPEGRDVGDGDAGYWLRHAADKSVDIVADDKVDAARENAELAERKRQEQAAAKKKADEDAAAKAKATESAPAASAPKATGQK